jgi:hypothetical protein
MGISRAFCPGKANPLLLRGSGLDSREARRPSFV